MSQKLLYRGLPISVLFTLSAFVQYFGIRAFV
jgi:hypothetical protein